MLLLFSSFVLVVDVVVFVVVVVSLSDDCATDVVGLLGSIGNGA